MPVKISTALINLGMAVSSAEANKYIRSGAVKVDGNTVTTDRDLEPGESQLSCGKRARGIVIEDSDGYDD